MRKHIIPFYLEAPTQVINDVGFQSWNGRSSKISITNGSNNTLLSIDAVASEGLIKPGTLLVIEWSVDSITAGSKVAINYNSSIISQLDAARETATLLFFNDRDSEDDATWEVIARNAPVVPLASADQAAVDLSSIADFPENDSASVGDSTDLEAVADAVRSLTTLTNQLRTDLIALGLIKGGA